MAHKCAAAQNDEKLSHNIRKQLCPEGHGFSRAAKAGKIRGFSH